MVESEEPVMGTSDLEPTWVTCRQPGDLLFTIGLRCGAALRDRALNLWGVP